MSVQHVVAQLEERGYHLAYEPCSDALLEFISPLGKILVDPRSPTPVRDIRPQPVAEAKANTLSSRYGLGGFPFHTDAAHWRIPARYLVLYCVQPGSGGRPTLMKDSRVWLERDDLKYAATREIWKSGHARPQLCTVGIMIKDRFAVRFDEACMIPMTAAASRLRDKIRTCIESSPIINVVWAPGTVLILDNHRMLHARGTAVRPDTDRVLRRILVGELT